MSQVEDFFGYLNKWIAPDVCSVAQKLKDPLPCQWAEVASLTYCKIHQGIKIKPQQKE